MTQLGRRRIHRERGQLGHRKHLGLLEKKKDYVLRAKDHHSKQNRLRALREKAANRNPDEFYFSMEKAKTKGGVHQGGNLDRDGLSHDTVALLKSQDAKYLKTVAQREARQVKKLKETLHFIPNTTTATDEAGEDASDLEALGLGPAPGSASQGSVSKGQGTHTLFFDSDGEAEEFDAVKHFDTVPELAKRRHNRPRVSTLRQQEVIGPDPSDKKAFLKIERARKMAYQELASRVERQRKLDHAAQELEVQRQVMGKGRKRKVREGTATTAPVYQWKKERKR
eukprot:TRINITY_DN977_c0_g1_i1.p1 TRINITY_DN977_c0_g1~~TRINITY_DN977_c0_g1_i1.p1  ORF type:complete len:282 (+),score=57.90 TRINITY_DN977_c0_g1_i1:130-975(+)